MNKNDFVLWKSLSNPGEYSVGVIRHRDDERCLIETSEDSLKPCSEEELIVLCHEEYRILDNLIRKRAGYERKK